ncbi:hypothetical protein CR205_06725 [Alteribacter lacisalsi]|uniref:Superoxide dismutase [Cu-Zn] n=1 Tax=Alteribacter lacisalsi TaxID=2045244 RepID=A0A2W0HBR9_9BACI|nr:superoxide dismutase family protein [Alteribacter lacisalsi]PYZ98286.1 hypothetical protein CR205_06725 [Alteribacter lacisalsi]
MNRLAFTFISVCLLLAASACAPDSPDYKSQSDGYKNNQGALEHGIKHESHHAVETFAGGHDVGKLEAAAHLKTADGQDAGKVSFFSIDDQVLVKAEVKNLSPSGFRGFHIHENGICEADAPDGPFTTAGGHYSPGGKDHDHHIGDMPSLYITGNTTGYMVAKLDRFSPSQLVEDQVAVIIHEDADNFANIPERYQSEKHDSPGPDQDTLKTGDAGPRQACGVVEASR